MYTIVPRGRHSEELNNGGLSILAKQRKLAQLGWLGGEGGRGLGAETVRRVRHPAGRSSKQRERCGLAGVSYL